MLYFFIPLPGINPIHDIFMFYVHFLQEILFKFLYFFDVNLIQQSIEQLPEAQRTIIQLRDIEGLSYDEIAQITGFTDSQVKVYLHRARKKIRESL